MAMDGGLLGILRFSLVNILPPMLATQILFICLEAVKSLIEILKKFKIFQNSVAISLNMWPFKLKCRGRFDSYGFGAVLYDNRKKSECDKGGAFLTPTEGTELWRLTHRI